MVNMGLGFGLESPNLCIKRKFRWLFKIPGISEQPVGALPPEKSARPSLSFKEIEAQHLNETIYFPGKPDWKPINLTLYDIKTNSNPIINWLDNQYNANTGTWGGVAGVPFGFGPDSLRSINVENSDPFRFKRTADLELLDGCGDVIERWTFENIWPNNIEWGELDYSDNQYVVIDLTLRYDRAYITRN